MRKYPMYTGYIDDENDGYDTPELYYKISVPLNNLSALPRFLDDLVMKEDF